MGIPCGSHMISASFADWVQALPCDENMNTGHNSKQPASAGTMGEKGRCRASARFNTLDNWGHKTPTQSKRKRTGKKRLKGHGLEHVYNTLGYTSFAGNPLLTFEPVTDKFVLKIINSAPAKSCELDPIPTTLLYENFDILLPTIINIINTSLSTGIVPHDLKTAVIKPLLKKPSFDKNLQKNYRPISNLPFLSKILEKVILHKLLSHLQENNLSNPFQPAYQAGHSTETVLLVL